MAGFPSTFSAFTHPQATDRLNSPSHSALHNSVSSAVGNLEAFIGRNGNNSVAGTIVYQIESPDSDGGGHVQTAIRGGTGQTNYNKGDLLVGQSSSVLTKLAVGGDGRALVADSTQPTGVKWGLPGGLPSVIALSTTSVYTVNPSKSYIRVQLIAAGGAANGNGGGGAGGYGESIIPVSSVSASVLITVGVRGSLLGDGTNTSFGNLIVCSGGQGASGNAGAIGGSVVGAQIQVPGGRGQTATGTGFVTGFGGVGFFGGMNTWGAGASPSQSAVGGYAIITEF